MRLLTILTGALLLGCDCVACLVQPLAEPLRKSAKIQPSDESWHPNFAKTFLTTLAASTILFTQAATALDPSVYSHDYADPLHPLCKRRVTVLEDGKTFKYRGTRVGATESEVLRGCSKQEIKEYGLFVGQFQGEILDNGRISAGDGVHEGVWEPAGSVSADVPFASVDGIRWNDGNKWTVLTKGTGKKLGEGLTYAYIGLSTLAGAFGVYRAQSRS